MTHHRTDLGGPLGRAWQRLSDRESFRLREAFVHSTPPPATPRHFFGVFLAFLVLGLSLASVLVGLWLAWVVLSPLPGMTELGIIPRLCWGLLALILLLFAVQARPRFPHLPGQEVSAQQAPELHRLIQEVATVLEVTPPTRILVDGEVNAFFGWSGFPPQSTLGLGLPLLYALPPQERVALIAHELAHQRNQDPTRGWVVRLALNVLAHTVNALSPDRLMAATGDALQQLAQGAMRGLALGPLGLYHLMLVLVGEEQQRAEFRADLLASEVAGHAATLSLLDHFHLTGLLESALHKQRHQPERAHAFLELGHLWSTLSEPERERSRAEVAAQRRQLDATHPPTTDRMVVVAAFPREPQVRLDEAQARRLEDELTPFVRPLEQAAYEAYQARYAQW
ncbi:M48 family metalloprotease [Deinococcus oregonensis]|uniref:M48 family metalloprotease n=1 Tax=Deinococcus oregonensis TaxID=1805970 RepID=A0ABV6AYU9_9DEIO